MPEFDETDRTNRPRTTGPDASGGWREEYASQHVEHAIATDGGRERPEDCGCWNVGQDLPCWACYREGFETQNPAEPAADEDDDVPEHPERAPLSAFTDGGATTELPAPGDRVRDDDADAAKEVIVVETHPDTPADEWLIEDLGATVAGVNPVFDPKSPVVEVVYAEAVSEKLDGWRSVEDLRDAVSFGALSTYTFPADRLAEYQGGERR